MISINELNNLLAKKKDLIDSFDPSKKAYFEGLKDEIIKLINRYNSLELQVDNKSKPVPDLSGALIMLDNLETKVNTKVAELRRMLSEEQPLSFKRDVSDAGTIGGNGSVIFRTNGKNFFVPKGTLTQDEIEAIIRSGKISSLI